MWQKNREISMLLLTVVIMSIVLAGCKNSEDDITGSWKAVKIDYEDQELTAEEIAEYGYEIVYTLKDDDTFTGLLIDTDVNGTYKIKASGIVLTYESGETETLAFEDSSLIGETEDMKVVLQKQ